MMCALAIITLTLASPAVATTFAPVPFEDFVEEAPLIVRGETESSEAKWVQEKEGPRKIFTFTDFRISEVIKGDLEGEKIKLRSVGGQVDGVGLSVAGSAQFAPGEDVVVMLMPQNADGSYTVKTMMMGKYNIARDANGQEVLQGGYVSHGAHEHIVNQKEEAEPDQTPWTLERLRNLVKAQAENTDSEPHSAPTIPVTTQEKSDGVKGIQATPGTSNEKAEQQSARPEVQATSPRNFNWWLIIGIGLVLAFVYWRLGRDKK